MEPAIALTRELARQHVTDHIEAAKAPLLARLGAVPGLRVSNRLVGMLRAIVAGGPEALAEARLIAAEWGVDVIENDVVTGFVGVGEPRGAPDIAVEYRPDPEEEAWQSPLSEVSPAAEGALQELVDQAQELGMGYGPPGIPATRRLDVEWLTDKHECETCGGSWASGARVHLDGEQILELIPLAHCFDGEDWSEADVYLPRGKCSIQTA
jgi:hypothetical protein